MDDIDRFVERVYSSAIISPLFKHEYGVRGTSNKRLHYFTNDDSVISDLLHPDPTPWMADRPGSMPDDFGGLYDGPGRPVDEDKGG